MTLPRKLTGSWGDAFQIRDSRFEILDFVEFDSCDEVNLRSRITILESEIPRSLERGHPHSHHIIHLNGLERVEGLAVFAADQASVVRVLDANQLVEVLAGGEQLARGRGAVELGAVAVDGFHLGVELGGDVDDERR